MQKKRLIKPFLFLFFFASIPNVHARDVSVYLILDDIGSYKLFTGIEGRVFSGPPSKYSQTSTGGVLDAAGHFSKNDVCYEVSYIRPGSKWPFVKVEVTQHGGSHSDKWLEHELQKDFRNYFGLPGDSFVMRQLDGQTIMAYGAGGWTYRWLSGNKAIHIEYTDLMMTRPEPLEIVGAYLSKHPSSLKEMTSYDLRTYGNQAKWIRDEMERRLWLCDKWFQAQNADDVDIDRTLREIGVHLDVFLDYREKYYGVSATKEKEVLAQYLYTKNAHAISNKLDRYKRWWSNNRGKAIALP
jgi:hypothetical protein